MQLNCFLSSLCCSDKMKKMRQEEALILKLIRITIETVIEIGIVGLIYAPRSWVLTSIPFLRSLI